MWDAIAAIALVGLLGGVVVGCASSQSTQMVEIASGPQDSRSVAEVHEVQYGNVSVRLLDYEGGDLFKFEIKNLSPLPIIVDRDAVELVVAGEGPRPREPGGARNAYSLPVGGVQVVSVRFDMATVSLGEAVKIDFSPALQMVGGSRVPVSAIVVKFR
jgi:hypothetical protein